MWKVLYAWQIYEKYPLGEETRIVIISMKLSDNDLFHKISVSLKYFFR